MRRFWLTAVVLVAIAGCSANGTESSSYQLTEFSIDGPGRLEDGIEAVAVSNRGEFPHTLVVTDETGTVVSATPLIQPGESTSLNLDLDPGTYSVTCRIVAQAPDGDIVDHFEAGMHTTLDVVG
jgi:uncharacterized cupredoxin-like copper-binding protein